VGDLIALLVALTRRMDSVGYVREPVKLYYRGKSLSVEALIDTGATTLVLPRRVAEELGVEVLGEMDVELAGGTAGRLHSCRGRVER